MPLSAAQRELVRGEIGQDVTVWPDDATLDSLFDGLGLQAGSDGLIDIRPLIVLVLKERKALMLGGALSFSVAGVYSENSTETVKALERQIDRVAMGDRSVTTRMMIRLSRARSGIGMPGQNQRSVLAQRGWRI